MPGLGEGEKQSKSLGNYVAVDHEPREKFGRLMRLIDPLVGEWLSVYSDLEEDEIAAIVKLQREHPMDAKYAMASAIVARYHGRDVAAQEQQWFQATFSKRQIPDDAEPVSLDQATLTVFDLVRRLSPESASNSEVRRLIKQGGVSIDGNRHADESEPVTFTEEPVPVKLGKRRWFMVSTTVPGR